MISEETLNRYGIDRIGEIVYNPSFDELFVAETSPELKGYERGILTETGAVTVDTGIFTGRSPKDKYIVLDSKTKDTVWWKSEKSPVSDNKPIDIKTWNHCRELAVKQLSGKKLYVVDCFSGANEDTRIRVRFIMEV